MRWPIEQCFEEGKSHLGMGDYGHRSWPALHEHVINVFLGRHFLLRFRLDKKIFAVTPPTSSAEIVSSSIAVGISKHKGDD